MPRKSKAKKTRKPRNRAVNVWTFAESWIQANLASELVTGTGLGNFLLSGTQLGTAMGYAPSGSGYIQGTSQSGVSQITLKELLSGKQLGNNVMAGKSVTEIMIQNTITGAVPYAMKAFGTKAVFKLITKQTGGLRRQANKALDAGGFGNMVRV